MSQSNVVKFGAVRVKEKDIETICDAALKCPATGAERMLEVIKENRHRNGNPHAAFTEVAFALYNRGCPDDIGARRNILDAVSAARERFYSQYAVA